MNSESLRKGYHLLRVCEIKPLIEDAVQIVFDLPDDLKGLFNYQSGQHLDLIINCDGEELYRSYSICSGPGEPLSIGVKTVLHGRVSHWLNKNLKEGDQIAVSEPRGSFVLNKAVSNIVLIAAGSGITPLLSMFKTAVSSSVQVTLIYGNSKSTSVMFAEEIDAMKSGRVIQYLSREQKEGFLSGRINSDNLSALAQNDCSLLDADAYYLCGPEEMISNVRAYLESAKVPAEKIFSELFTAPIKIAASQPELKNGYSGKCHLNITLEGDKYQMEVETDISSILDAAIKAGIDAPNSCKSGVCGSCRAKVLQGHAIIINNYALTEKEVAEGYILTCQALPSGEMVHLSYDD
jgi:ring-1,2-phenylacetyl-CoA epoxidase subunit PaaE